MGFKYQRGKSHDESGVQWTSYSDLFMSLSVIFLLLYVTASLRQGATSIQESIENQKLSQEVEDLRSQIKVYNTLKEDYMENGASEKDKQVYDSLMSQLNLLKDQTTDDRQQLLQQAKDDEDKENALNQYQKLVRNIINANLVSSARLRRRDNIISQKDDVITQKYAQIKNLEKSVAEKKDIIVQNEHTISDVQSRLDNKMDELRQAYSNQEITKKKLDTETIRIKKEAKKQLEALNSQKTQMSTQLADLNSKLVTVNSQLEDTQEKFEKENQEKTRLKQELDAADTKYSGQIDQLTRDYDARREGDRKTFEKELHKYKLSDAARAAKEAAFKAESAKQSEELAQKIGALNAKIKETQGKFEKAQARADERKMLANEIKRNLAQGGVKADVDENTGDVVLDFGQQYFDTGRADLKNGMKDVLEKAVPLYARSLLQNKKVAGKISAVEIIGFASPTYKGKYVDPQSLNPQDRGAVDYNLDLSFSRARSIFRYIFDTNKMTFDYQKQLLPLVKVTGRSYLAGEKENRGLASGMTQKEFCEAHDCTKAQKVIIKFTLDE